MSEAATYGDRGAAICGIGEVLQGRDATLIEEEDLLMLAILRAIDDAGLRPSDVDGVCIPDPKLAIRSWDVEWRLGCSLSFSAISPVEGPAGIGWSVRRAAAAVDSGEANAVLVYYGRNQRSQAARMSPLLYHGEDPNKAAYEIPYGWYPQVAYMATMFNRHAYEYGTTTEALAHVAIAMREHAGRHPEAFRRTRLSRRDYEESRLVADPLRAADCSLITDGAGAVIVTSRSRAGDCSSVPVGVLATSIGHAADRYYYALSEPFLEGAGEDSRDVFDAAGVAVADIDLLYLFDAFSFMLMLQLEELGVCGRGESGGYLESRGIGPGSKQPVNTHGGCLAHAHVTGMNHLIEAVRQLRSEAGERQQEGAETALYSGFLWRDWCNVVLAR